MLDKYTKPFRFYILSCVIPWSFWLAAAYLSHRANAAEYSWAVGALSLAGLCSPLGVVAFFISRDKRLLSDVAGRFVNVPPGGTHYVYLALLLMPASIVLAMAISLLFGYDADQFTITGNATFSSALFPVWFLLIIAPVVEELAWHSYGTDCLRQKFNLFITSMIFAFYWALWHLPLALIKGYYHSNLVAEGVLHSLNFMVSLFPFVLLMNWLYYKTGRNILVAVVLHLCANIFNEIFATHPDSKVIQTGLLLILAAYLLCTQREFFFRKTCSHQAIGPERNQPQVSGEEQYNVY